MSGGANRIEQLHRERPDATGFARGYLDYVTEVLAGLSVAPIASFVDLLVTARGRDARIFFIGNGGSASTAGHFALDLVARCRNSERPLRAVSLTDNTGLLTALANDYGYENVFVRQLQTQMTSGDVVVAISVSGHSPNVVEALKYANEHGALTVALTAAGGGALADLAQLVVNVPTNDGEYGPAEDVHLIVNHLVAAFLAHASTSPVTTSGAEASLSAEPFGLRPQ